MLANSAALAPERALIASPRSSDALCRTTGISRRGATVDGALVDGSAPASWRAARCVAWTARATCSAGRSATAARAIAASQVATIMRSRLAAASTASASTVAGLAVGRRARL